MPKFFGIDIAAELAREMGPGLLPVILSKVTNNSRTTGSLTAGKQATYEDYAGRGLIEDYLDKEINGTVVKTGDRKVLILGGSLPVSIVPEVGDRITIESAIYRIERVMRDPAAAAYTCQVRGV